MWSNFLWILSAKNYLEYTLCTFKIIFSSENPTFENMFSNLLHISNTY